jgi:REP element-mobilizing transposase RayT
MADTKTLLKENSTYHIYNHAVGTDLLFKSDRNYRFFMHQIKKYLIDHLEFFAYCLMPNHFHLLVRVKENQQLLSELDFSYKISQQFSHCFNSYAQAFNKENGRMGSLFANRFKRILIESDEHFKTLIIYIHNNPVKAGLVSYPEDWKYSSYKEILLNTETIIQRDEVISSFDDLDNFIFCHAPKPYEGFKTLVGF